MKSSFDLIKPLMDSRGITKSRLAEIAEVAPSAVTKWMRGGEIRRPRLLKIATFFGVDIRELLPCEAPIKVPEGSADALELEQWKRRAIGAEEELRRYKVAFAKIAKSLKLASEAVGDLYAEEVNQ